MAEISPNAFLKQIATTIPKLLPDELANLATEPHGRLLKLWYGEDKQVHYEIWIFEQGQLIEIGLHFEAKTADFNEAVRRGLCNELFEIKHRLGPQVEVEHWMHGWTKVYEIHPFHPIDERRVKEIAARCARFIVAVQPLYEEVVEALPAWAPRLNIVARRE